MSFLLDTNLISELRKGSKCNQSVWNWYQAVSMEELFLSVLTPGEIRRGIEMCRLKDAARARVYESWLRGLENGFKERILPVTDEIADLWGRLSVRQPIPIIDGLLAATAQHHGLTVVTRNTADFQRSGVDYLNPFTD
jgi:toxin FitB